jgi:hypothetical protein
LHLLLPLVSAIVYVVGALLLKRASDLGADVWRTTRVINYTSVLVAAPLWLLGGNIPSWTQWWQPPAAAVLFTRLCACGGPISIYRQAPSANVLYSSRGLWTVVAVWGIGHWFSNREQLSRLRRVNRIRLLRQPFYQ